MKKLLQKMVCCIAVLALVLTMAPTQQVEAADSSDGSTEKYVSLTVTRDYDYINQVLTLVNQERANAGLAALKLDYNLTEVAMQRAAETTIKFDHTRPNGEMCFTLFPSSVGGWIGENIAAGQSSPAAVVESWMNSEGHKENILNSNYNYIGIGCVKTNSGYVYWTQCFAGSIDYVAETRTGQKSYTGYYAYTENTVKKDLGGVDLSAVFDAEYYLNKYSDVKKAYDNDTGKAFQHFLNYGMKEGRQGCESFDVTSYKNRYADLQKAYGSDLVKYYYHYVNYGQKEGRNGTKASTTTSTSGTGSTSGTTTSSLASYYAPVFDAQSYLNRYADVKAAYGNDEEAALKHFIQYGMKEGRQGNDTFVVQFYKMNYADLQKAYGNDWTKYYEHYIMYGAKENRNAANPQEYSLVFDADYYLNNNTDLAKAYGTQKYKAFQHFLNYGMKEGRTAIATFNVKAYKEQYADLQKAYGSDLKSYYIHYIKYGYKEGRKGTY